MDASDSGTSGASLQQGHESAGAHRRVRDTFDESWFAGDREAAQTLTEELGKSALFLFNRRVGFGAIRGEICIIAIAASGVYVLDPKDYAGRKVRANPRHTAFVINGRVRPAIADSMRRHVDALRVAMATGPFPAAPVSGAYCFMGADLPFGRLIVDDLPATTLRGAVKLLKRRGPLTAAKRTQLHAYLSEQFPPA